MKKIIHLESHFPSTGEVTVQPVFLWANNRPCREGITKHASVGDDYFRTITPIPGHSIVYVLALGAWETYGENRNGDSFSEFPYKEEETPPWIAPGDVLPQHYKSFENGHNFRHHVNKDPNKRVGDVMKSFWNPMMHRVELLIDLDNKKAPDLADRIASGEYPPVSMGTRVKYDVCSICGNRAPTRMQYCDHLKFQMKAVLPDGRVVSALNPSPKFFDISWVFRPADPTAYMLKKVAEEVAPYELTGAAAGEYLDDIEERKIASHKLAVIDKVVQGLPVDAKVDGVNPTDLNNLVKMRDMVLQAGGNTPTLPDNTLRGLSQFPLRKVFSTASSGGIMMNTPEITKIVIYKSSPKMQVSDDVMDKNVLLQNAILGLFKDCPQLLDTFEESGIFDLAPQNVEPKIAQILDPYFEKRSGIGEYLGRRFVPEKYRAPEMPMTTSLSVSDPLTNTRYMTTRGAAIKAHDEVAKRNLYKVMGGAALLGGAYKIIGSGLERIGRRRLKPLVALTLGATGAAYWPTMGKHYMTDQGVPIPTLTELHSSKHASVTSLALPAFGTLATMAVLGHDYKSRLQRGEPVGHPRLPLSRRLLDKVEGFVYDHPVLSAGLGTAGAFTLGRSSYGRTAKKFLGGASGRAREALRGLGTGSIKMSEWLGGDLPTPQDTVVLPALNVDRIAEKIGELILEG